MIRSATTFRRRVVWSCLTLLLSGGVGCSSSRPWERVVRLWRFEAGVAELPVGGFTRATDLVDGAPAHVAAAGRTRDGGSLLVQLPVPPRLPVGTPARLRFRCRLVGAAKLTVQKFDVTVQDHRHIELPDLPNGTWLAFEPDFTRESRRNDGTRDAFAAGHTVDDAFFFVLGAGPDARLWVDGVTLYRPGHP